MHYSKIVFNYVLLLLYSLFSICSYYIQCIVFKETVSFVYVGNADRFSFAPFIIAECQSLSTSTTKWERVTWSLYWKYRIFVFASSSRMEWQESIGRSEYVHLGRVAVKLTYCFILHYFNNSIVFGYSIYYLWYQVLVHGFWSVFRILDD